MKKLTITESQFFWMFRYCLGRSSYAVADCVDAINSNWNAISKDTKTLIAKEIEEHLGREKHGTIVFACDEQAWKDIMDRISNESK